MIKTVMPGDYAWDDPQAVLVDVGSRGISRDQMQKRASCGVFRDVDIKAKPGRSVLHIIALGDAERYGCFFAGAPVQTVDGQVSIEDVEPGTRVLTHANRYRRVVRRFESSYTGTRASIKCLCLPDAVVSTGNHPYLVVRGEDLLPGRVFRWRNDGVYVEKLDELVRGATWVPADQVRPGDYMLIPTAAKEPEVLPAAADPYVMGLYVADGCLSAELQGVDIAFGHQAHTKHVHPSVFGWSREGRLKFLAGYFDGDGCLDTAGGTRYHGTLSANTVSRSLALDIQRLCASVGVCASVSRCHNYEGHRRGDGFGKGLGDRVIYVITIGSSCSNAILTWCQRLRPHTKPPYGRGGSSIRLASDYMLVRVSEVALDYVEDATRYNLEVEGDNSFVVDVIAHNSNRNRDRFYGHPREVEFPEPKGKKSVKLQTGNASQAWTFERYAKVYRDHKNRKTDKAYGDVIKAAHNAPMARVELLIDVPHDDPVWRDDIEKVATGGDIFFSMSCKVPGDHCFPAGTMITTSRGPIPIQEIEPGDLVVTKDSGYRAVDACIRHEHTGEMVGLTPQGLPEILSTSNHPYFVVRRHEIRACHGSANGVKRRHTPGPDNKCTTCGLVLDYAVSVVPAIDVCVGDYVLCPSATGTIGATRDFAYALGVYAGDGHVISQRAGKAKRGAYKDMGVGFSIGDGDPHLARLERALAFCKNEPRYSRESGEKRAGRLRVSDQQFADAVQRLVGRGSHSKTLAGLFSTREAALAFLAGCLDSDGHVDAKSGHARIATVSEALARSIIDVCTSVGVIASLRRQDDVDTTYGRVDHIWCVYVPASFRNTIGESDKFRLRGKRTRLGCSSFSWNGYVCREVRSTRVCDVAGVPVYNLDVAGDDETYVAGGVAVHNCSICGNFSKSRDSSRGGTDCDHIRNHLGVLTKSGHTVDMVNDNMVFFDISRVRVPADRIAYSLLKAASVAGDELQDIREQHEFVLPVITAEDDPFNLFSSKQSKALQKLSEIEKKIEAVGRAPVESLAFDPGVKTRLSDEDYEALGRNRGDLGAVLSALADHKICLSLPEFIRLLLGDRAEGCKGSIRVAADALPGVFTRLLEASGGDDVLPESLLPESSAPIPERLSEFIESLVGGMSLADAPVANRITVVSIRRVPRPELKSASVLHDTTADNMVKAYAAYKLAWCQKAGIDSRATELAVLQHYIGSD